MDRYSILTSNCWGGRACFDSLFVFIFFTHNACKTPRLEICMNNLPFFLLVKFRSNILIFF